MLKESTKKKLENSGWLSHLKPFLESERCNELKKFLHGRIKDKDNEVFPEVDKWFRALIETPYDSVRVVIIGQDPYHGPGQANGLAFAVNNNVIIPPSLRNIFKEVENNTGFKPKDRTLVSWARQGVLLLNTTLTVDKALPGSHRHKGWESFTDCVIEALKSKSNIVYMLWGEHAKEKAGKICYRNLVLKSAHPSPFSAHKGFFGREHFNKANIFLKEEKGEKPIDWSGQSKVSRAISLISGDDTYYVYRELKDIPYDRK